MVYLKVVLDNRKIKANGIYSIVVRLTYNRRMTTLSTGVRISQNQWNDKASQITSAHPNFQLLNKAVTEFYLKVQKLSMQLEDAEEFSFEALKEALSETKPTAKITKVTYFKEYADSLISDMIMINKAGNAVIYQTATNRFMGFVNNPKLKFTEINYTLLEAFKGKLIKDGVKQNTISNYFRTLRAIYNKAIKAKLVDRAHYPFLDVTVKTERTAKRAITSDDLIAIWKHPLQPKSRQWHARNYFFLSFSLIGASFTDLAYLTNTNAKKGRVIYRRKKTGQELNIRITPFSRTILEYYSGANAKYLLPVLPIDAIEGSLEAKATISQWIKTTNKWLNDIVKTCKLNCEVTTYVARHTWATTAKRLGYSTEIIAEAMGHEHGNRITNIYLDNFDQKLIDDLNSKVLELLE